MVTHFLVEKESTWSRIRELVIIGKGVGIITGKSLLLQRDVYISMGTVTRSFFFTHDSVLDHGSASEVIVKNTIKPIIHSTSAMFF